MGEDENRRGFSGLSGLTSDLNSGSPPTSESAVSSIPPTVPPVIPTLQTAARGESANGSGWKWVLGGAVGFVLFIIVVANQGEQGANSKPYSPSQSPQTYSPPSSNSVPSVSPNSFQSAQVQIEKPSVGTGNVLSVPQLCWCLREKIRIEAMRPFVDFNSGVGEFNYMVSDYNCRCGNFKYMGGALGRAQRQIDAIRSKIVEEAFADAQRFSSANRSSSTQGSSQGLPSTVSTNPYTQVITEVQTLLTLLGYDLGPVDGQHGPRTAAAVKAFQAKIGTLQDGVIDSDLINSLRQAQSMRSR